MSKNPLRRVSEQLLLTSMRPPLTERLQPRGHIDVAGKRILLTGASSGIGEAAAEKFAAKGATVIAVAPPSGTARRPGRADHRQGRRRRRPRGGPLRHGRHRRTGRHRGTRSGRRRHPDQQRRPVDPAPPRRIAGPLARRRAHHDAQLLLAAAAHPRHWRRACASGARGTSSTSPPGA